MNYIMTNVIYLSIGNHNSKPLHFHEKTPHDKFVDARHLRMRRDAEAHDEKQLEKRYSTGR